MIGVDTNILVRFLARDHAPQYQAARAIMESGQVFVPESVLLETEWVLRGIYKFSSPEIRRAHEINFAASRRTSGIHRRHYETRKTKNHS